jgi:hypothetical protein
MESGPPTSAGGPGIKTNDKYGHTAGFPCYNYIDYANYNPGWYHSWGTESNFLT